ncbi:large ribosomal subunit protein uL18m-like [Liolophura sinensis]|uniref:large ribosomal subunit protein uL18m-like n=1 Tax=Liolophura sinensis TaxID=3198878 RepID=UPI0031580F1F
MSSQELGCHFFRRIFRLSRITSPPLVHNKGLAVLPRCCCCQTSRQMSSQSNRDYEVNPEFVNRNPRNLESMGLARKTTGWTYQYPRKDYYNKLIFEITNRNTAGYIEHSNGKRIISASTSEWPIRQHLYSCTDVIAAQSIGRILAHRCHQAGLSQVFCDYDERSLSQKFKVFIQAMKDGDIELSEPKVIKAGIEPGIDYDNPKGNRYAEKKRWKDDVQVIS